MHSYATPGSPNFGIVRPIESDTKISQEDQKLYRSGNGMLIYLVKHSCPDIYNAVRDLSKVLDGASPAAFKEMHRAINYVLENKNLGLKLEPNSFKRAPWDLD